MPSFTAVTPQINTTTTPKTLAVLKAPAGGRTGVRLTSLFVGFQGVTATDVPVLVEVCRASTDGTLAGTATPVELDGSAVYTGGASGCAVSTGATGNAANTAEPTIIETLYRFTAHPQGGSVSWSWPLDRAPIIHDSTRNGRLCVRVTAAANTTCYATLEWAE